MKPHIFNSTRPRPLLTTECKLWLTTASTLIPLALITWLWWQQPVLTAQSGAMIFAVSMGWILLAAFRVRRIFVHQLRTLNTLIEAIRNEDYSLRSAHTGRSNELSALFQQINSLAQQLQSSRQEEQELRGLLERIIAQMNVAVLACDSKGCIVLANPQAARLLAMEREALQGLPLESTEISSLLPALEPEIREHRFAGASGRWQISQQTLVQDGKPGSLIFITDLEQVLSEEEIRAWQRLIRVIAHEVNNSLTPITTLCQTLAVVPPEGDRGQLAEGLQLIHERALNLRNFISDYARIARLPEANKGEFDLLELVRKVAGMYSDCNIRLHLQAVPEKLPVFGDRTQLEQVLINLIKNAVEANANPSISIDISIMARDDNCDILIRDQGPGISNKSNLFVPFYTTKDQGAGIGLALSRRIISAHHGNIALDNRDDASGAELRLTLPLLSRTTNTVPETGR